MNTKLLVPIFIYIGCLALTKLSAQINIKDSLVLVNLYNETNGQHWINKWNLSQPISTWYGVSTNDNRVTGLNLTYTIGLQKLGVGLKGNIPASLGNLPKLNTLDLSYNHLTGTIPSELGNLKSLMKLDLSDNPLKGSIPLSFGNLRSLTELLLDGNRLTGNIPDTLSNLKNLLILHIVNNRLTGSIPASLSKLKNLKILDLWNNKLTGHIPASLGDLYNLSYLDLPMNRLTGTIPKTFKNLVNLKSLSLYLNNLEGTIPSFLGELTNLTYLSLSNNNFSGEVPASLTNLKNILPGPGISANRLTFAGLEKFVTAFPAADYSYQAAIPVHNNENILSVSVGGTASNNIYKWYRNNKLYKKIKGDSTLTVTDTGKYFVKVKNRIAIYLTLMSDEVSVDKLPVHIAYSKIDSTSFINNKFTFTPNPAENNITVTLTNISSVSQFAIYTIEGKKIMSDEIAANNNSKQINVSNLKAGIYNIVLLQNGKQQNQRLVKK